MPGGDVLDETTEATQQRLGLRVARLDLAGYAVLRPSAAADVEPAPAHVQRLLAELDHPAYALAADWWIAAWNSAYAALYPNIASAEHEQRNLLWLVFTDPDVRDLLADWDDTASRFLAEFRAENASRLGDSRVDALVARLRDASPKFREAWDGHAIAGFESRERVFHHPTAGTLRFEHHQLRPSDRPNLQLIVYTPLDRDTRTRLAHL